MLEGATWAVNQVYGGEGRLWELQISGYVFNLNRVLEPVIS